MSVRHEKSAQQIPLTHPQATPLFALVLPMPRATALQDNGVLSDAYMLVASWNNSREHLRLALHPRMGPKVDVSIYRVEGDFRSDARIDEIEALGDDRDSRLEAYFRARAAHRYWRHTLDLPRHRAALRTAKLWFDAAYKLAVGANSPFVMDKDISTIMSAYEAEANQDASFRERLRKHVRAGYVKEMVEEATAAQYVVVGEIPKLASAGALSDAAALNATALIALQAESLSVREVVAKRQGITLDVLRGNAAFLASAAETP